MRDCQKILPLLCLNLFFITSFPCLCPANDHLESSLQRNASIQHSKTFNTIEELGVSTKAPDLNIAQDYHNFFNLQNFIFGMIFSGIGFVAFMYAKKMAEVKRMVIGLVLMIYPYFVQNTIVLCSIGIVLIAAIFFIQE